MTLAAHAADALDGEAQSRLQSDVQSALRRRPAHEARLAGVVRALAPLSPALRNALLVALATMVRRGSFERPLYSALVRALATSDEAQVGEVIARALSAEDGGGLASLSAACFCRHRALGEPLARAAISRHAHVAFAAEVARLARGESSSGAVASLAPKIKESHRIALCVELLAPLVAARPLAASIAPALRVLRDAERHLGRWLVLAEVAARAGDRSCQAEAEQRAQRGPQSARSAWALVAWALDPGRGAPNVRPTLELVARLSDRPSADKDTTFLFRLAAARAPSARALLESLARSAPLGDECAVRAMLHLCRDYGEERYRQSLLAITRTPRKDPLRALAAAALYDLGEHAPAQSALRELEKSRHLAALAWAALVRGQAQLPPGHFVVNELSFRRVQLGWVE